MKVRIGNDILLKVTLGEKDSDSFINIHSVKVYLINKTEREKRVEENKKKNRFISRFPVEPRIDVYNATEYNVHTSGRPGYHTIPINAKHPAYAGFGLNPDWANIYPMMKWDDTKYRAVVNATDKQDTFEVLFPAEDQIYVGDYKLIVVANIFKSGYRNNLKTITIDYDDVFTLVKTTEEGVDGKTTITVGESTHDSREGDIYVREGDYNIDTDEIKLRRTDETDVHVDVSGINSWYEGE